jgi:hypothetical protein
MDFWYDLSMPNTPALTEADILAEVIAPDEADWSAAGARALLDLKFTKEATKQIRQLLRKNNRGTITAPERLMLEKYLRVGRFLDLVQAKARLSLFHSADNR